VRSGARLFRHFALARATLQSSTQRAMHPFSKTSAMPPYATSRALVHCDPPASWRGARVSYRALRDVSLGFVAGASRRLLSSHPASVLTSAGSGSSDGSRERQPATRASRRAFAERAHRVGVCVRLLSSGEEL